MLFGRRAAVLGMLGLASSGCGGETGTAGVGGAGGSGGGVEECLLGEVKLLDGGCAAAGVPQDGCADGFEWREGGCYPMLPAAPCAPGQMALPGESSCRDVALCGSAPWGDIPVEADTVYVDASFVGAGSDGSATAPFLTIQEGIAAAPAGAIVAVAAGSYAGKVRIGGKNLRLWGRCPSMVELSGGTEVNEASVEVVDVPGTMEVRGLAVTGIGFGISASHSADVLIEGVWVHDTAVACVSVVDANGAAALQLRGSLVERCGQAGALAAGSELSIVESELRDIRERVGAPIATALVLAPGVFSNVPSQGLVQSSLLHGTRGSGVLVFGSYASLLGTVIQDVQALESNQQDGEGIIVKSEQGVRAYVELEGTTIVRTREAGVLVLDGEVTLRQATVSDTRAQASDQTGGNGVAVHAPQSDAASLLWIDHSLVELSLGFGVLASDAHATIEGSWIRDTARMPSEDLFGDGAAVVSYRLATSLAMTQSFVSGSARAGVSNFSSSVGLGEDVLWCNEIDLDGEITTTPFVFEGAEATHCGCGEGLASCQVVSASLQAPAAP